MALQLVLFYSIGFASGIVAVIVIGFITRKKMKSIKDLDVKQ